MFFRLFIVSGILFSFSLTHLQAQEKKNSVETTFEYTNRIKGLIETLAKLSPEDYPTKIESVRNELVKYFEHKKLVCNGDFSTLVIDKSISINQKNNQKIKLSKTERALCFREMKALQVTFLHQLFNARKKFLSFIMKKNIAQLNELHERSIKNVHKSFGRP